MTRFLIAVALMPVGYALGIVLAAMLMFGVERGSVKGPASIAAIPPNPTPIKAPPPPVAAPPYSGPRVMPPWPRYSSTGWYETPKGECELLPDREETQLCVQYPLRESILNSAVLGLDPRRPAIARYKPDRRKSCPITVAPGELRAVICGKLAERYELYCCD